MEVANDYNICMIAGKGGLGRLITWFHFAELPEEAQKIHDNEIVFLTGTLLRKKKDFVEFAKTAMQCNASALLVLASNIPRDIVELCNEQEFPLLTMDENIDVSSVSRLLCVQLLESEKANRQLFSAMKNAISFPNKTDLYVPTLIQYGFSQHDHFAVAIIKMKNFDQLSSAEIQWLVNQMEQQLLATGDKSFILTMENIFVLVFAQYTEKEVHSLMLKIISLLRMKEYSFYAGVSLNVAGIEKLSQAYMQAKHVVALGEKKEWTNTLRSYNDLGIYQLFLKIRILRKIS